ncbi:hypothetical protein [Agromyces seonyuensis]|uniref:Uncharacterized protein n=1 Tax=Agromyces seonyuensis TaxID=2662446 RepID=A0A6I4NU33_9MICO|nr:hypothetical protein [Agromyces seonyuensis]MWB97956.1 hypothetical protein [Agromyces seonyuensis]
MSDRPNPDPDADAVPAEPAEPDPAHRRELERVAWGSDADDAERDAARAELAALAAPRRDLVTTRGVPFPHEFDEPGAGRTYSAAEPDDVPAEEPPNRGRAVGFALLSVVAALAVVAVSVSLLVRDDETTVAVTDAPSPAASPPASEPEPIALDVFVRQQIPADLPDASRDLAAVGEMDAATLRLLSADGELAAYAGRSATIDAASADSICLIVVSDTAAGTNCWPDTPTFLDAGRIDVYWDDGSGVTGATWKVDGSVEFSHRDG